MTKSHLQGFNCIWKSFTVKDDIVVKDNSSLSLCSVGLELEYERRAMYITFHIMA